MNRLAQLINYHLGSLTDPEIVRTLRGDWSQERLARESGVSRNVIANVEVGRQRLYVAQLIQLAQARQ